MSWMWYFFYSYGQKRIARYQNKVSLNDLHFYYKELISGSWSAISEYDSILMIKDILIDLQIVEMKKGRIRMYLTRRAVVRGVFMPI